MNSSIWMEYLQAWLNYNILLQGEVKEWGTPDELINMDGIFTSMAKAAGIVN